MNDKTAAMLVEINHQFYQSCARSFSKTRRRVQPGVKRSIAGYLQHTIPSQILDVGCGNGELAKVISEKGTSGTYIGIDFSDALIREFTPANTGADFQIRWLVRDLMRPDWYEGLGQGSFDRILCFAVLHHIPGLNNQLRILKDIRQLLKSDGILIFSVWQFLSSQKLVHRIQSWDTVGMHDSDVDEGDYLLDWRADGNLDCLRYVHHFTSNNLEEMRRECKYKQIEQFLSDGVNDQLGLYNVWQPA